jgi:hypothetical protein
MRKVLTASALLVLLGATPGEARPYPYCARTPMNGGNPECMYVTLQQCMAFINGIGGDCIQNPAAVAYGQGRGSRNGPPQGQSWQGGNGWNNGQNNRY